MLKHNLFVREIVMYVCTLIQGLYWLPTFIHCVKKLHHAKRVVKLVQSVIVTCGHKLIILVQVNVIELTSDYFEMDYGSLSNDNE